VNLAVNCYEKGGKLFGGGGKEAGHAAAVRVGWLEMGYKGERRKGVRDNGDKRRLGNWGDLGRLTSCSRKYIVSSFQEKSRLLLVTTYLVV
jgi:hypothetical protein